jgi:flagellar biogenesis protein FliO
MTEALVTIAGGLLAVLGAWGLWLRRVGGVTNGDAIRVVTSRYLGTKQLVTLIEVDGERLLLGVAGDHVSLVARLGPSEGAASGKTPASEQGGAAPSDCRGAKAVPPCSLAGAPPETPPEL